MARGSLKRKAIEDILRVESVQQEFYSQLEFEEHEQAQTDAAEIAAAAVKHRKVRESAANAAEQAAFEEKRRRHQHSLLEAQNAADRRKQEAAFQEAESRIRAEQREEERLAEARYQAHLEREAEKEQQHRQQQEARRKEQEEAARCAEAAEREAAEAKDRPPAPAPGTEQRRDAPRSGGNALPPRDAPRDPTKTSHDRIHAQYLEIHRQLKGLRASVKDFAKQNKPFKDFTGDSRRSIRKSIGQLTGDAGALKRPLADIKAVMDRAVSMRQPALDVRPFLAADLSSLDASVCQVPMALLYALNIFSKAIVSQLADEAGADTKTADPIGLVGIRIFASPEYQWQERSLIDTLLAKYHVACPLLFGITGDDKMEHGRRKLGWPRDKDSGQWMPESNFVSRMTGLGVGFAALSLRDFRNARLANPLPAAQYWAALARIVNTPPAQTTQYHFVVLKALVDRHAKNFISFYGRAATVALRKAVREFPASLPAARRSAASSAVSTMSLTLEKEYGVRL